MKKRTKKLSLVRETLNRLQSTDLNKIRGGDPIDPFLRENSAPCESVGCGGTGSTCPTMTICSNC
ncbi:MAG TPA: class I lanthipeptide [Thermoanaerobaculia bacterium]|nr:class I lanthipeptide [Thermoanaerobaculia bacterium]